MKTLQCFLFLLVLSAIASAQTGPVYNGGGSGGVTPAPQYSIPCYNASGTVGNVSGCAGLQTDANGDLSVTGTSSTASPFTSNSPSGQSAPLANWIVNSIAVATILPDGTYTGLVPLTDLPQAPANTSCGNPSSSTATISCGTAIDVSGNITGNSLASTMAGAGGFAYAQGDAPSMANLSTFIIPALAPQSVSQAYANIYPGSPWTGMLIGSQSTAATFSACTVSGGTVASCPNPSPAGTYPQKPGCWIQGTGSITTTATCSFVMSGTAPNLSIASVTINNAGAGYSTATPAATVLELETPSNPCSGTSQVPAWNHTAGTWVSPCYSVSGTGSLVGNQQPSMTGTVQIVSATGTTGPNLIVTGASGLNPGYENGPGVLITDNQTTTYANASLLDLECPLFANDSTTVGFYLGDGTNGILSADCSARVVSLGAPAHGVPLRMSNSTTAGGYVQLQPVSGTLGASQAAFPINTTLANATVAELGLAETFTATQTLTGGLVVGEATKTSSYTGNSTPDSGYLVVMNCSSACTYTFNGSPANGYYGGVLSVGSTLATISLNGKNYNGAASVPALNSYRPLWFNSDGTNYFGDAPLVAGTSVSLTPTSNGLTIAFTGSGTGTVTTTGSFPGRLRSPMRPRPISSVCLVVAPARCCSEQTGIATQEEPVADRFLIQSPTRLRNTHRGFRSRRPTL
jgi:hypothetical protein